MADSRNAAKVMTEPEHHEKISARAYELWMERGCPIGSPEIDWHRAEAEITLGEGTPTRRFAA
jgi:hypothetical protein